MASTKSEATFNSPNEPQQQQEPCLRKQKEIDIKNAFARASYESATFVLTRYPYLCAVLLMVTTAEDAKEKKIERGSMKYRMAYFHLGAYFVNATIMAFDMFGLKRLFSILTCFHLAFVSYTEYSLSYGEQIAYRLLTRNVACIGCYLMVAGGLAKNKGEGDRSSRLVSFGRQLVAVYAVLSVVLAWNDRKEFGAYLEHSFHDPLVVYALMVVQLSLGLCLYAGYNVVQISKYYALLLVAETVLVDADVDFWTRHVGLKTWNTASIACRHLPIVAAMILIRKGYT